MFPLLLGELDRGALPRDFELWGMQYDGAWFDVGNKRDYIRVNQAILDGEVQVRLPYEQVPWGHVGSGVDIDYGRVTIVPPVVIGDGCAIEPGATIGPHAVIGDGWSVGAGAHIERSVLWPRLAFRRDDGQVIAAADRQEVEPHEVAGGVTIRDSIVVGGRIGRDLEEMVADVNEAGEVAVYDLDYVPSGPRA